MRLPSHTPVIIRNPEGDQTGNERKCSMAEETIEKLTDDDQRIIDDALQSYEINRRANLELANAEWSDVPQRFGPGSYGQHEASTVVTVLLESWDNHVLNHTATALNPRAYKLAFLAESLMAEVFQLLASEDAAAEEPTPC